MTMGEPMMRLPGVLDNDTALAQVLQRWQPEWPEEVEQFKGDLAAALTEHGQAVREMCAEAAKQEVGYYAAPAAIRALDVTVTAD